MDFRLTLSGSWKKVRSFVGGVGSSEGEGEDDESPSLADMRTMADIAALLR